MLRIQAAPKLAHNSMNDNSSFQVQHFGNQKEKLSILSQEAIYFSSFFGLAANC
jgi:hypothetical protein